MNYNGFLSIKDDQNEHMYDSQSDTQDLNIKKVDFRTVLDSLTDLLEYKNDKYGNSALEPVNIFSRLDAKDGILLRLDDKIKRIKTRTKYGHPPRKNDIVDMMGYLTLLCIELGYDDFSEFKD